MHNRFVRAIALAAATAFLSAGCLNPRYTRLPTFRFGNPVAERENLERHDPFPNSEFGPDTFARPRSFINSRTNIRRIREEEARRGTNAPAPPFGGASPPGPASQGSYPGVVRE